MPPSQSPSPSPTPRITAGARKLQDKLHDVLSRLSGTIEQVKNWPESTDTSVHVESTTKLIASIRHILAALQSVESTVRDDAELRQTLQSLLIPLDLLELLDHALNPDCFSRGLLKEAMGQFAGLKRRKRALEMLGATIQKGLDERLQLQNEKDTGNAWPNRETSTKEAHDVQPPTKKPKIQLSVDPSEIAE